MTFEFWYDMGFWNALIIAFPSLLIMGFGNETKKSIVYGISVSLLIYIGFFLHENWSYFMDVFLDYLNLM